MDNEKATTQSPDDVEKNVYTKPAIEEHEIDHQALTPQVLSPGAC